MRWAAAALTAAGVPFGLALTGGHVHPPSTAALTVTLAGLCLLLPRWPVAVLALSVSTVVALHTAHLIGTGWAWPATAAFTVLALAGRWRAVAWTAGLALAFGLQWDLYVERHSADWVLTRVAGDALWLAAVLAAAQAYRSTRAWQVEVAARLERDRYEREREAQRRRAEERVGIARDLHDVVSHTLAVVGVHLNVALDAFDTEPREARAAIELAQGVRGRAMTDLRALVDVLRDGDPGEPAGGLEQLGELTGRVRAAGLAVTLTEEGDRGIVPAPVATAVHRVVQESLTNTVRHAGAARAEVHLTYAPAAVTVEVRDDGRAAGPHADGHGIAGMRERVAALGGALTAGAGATGFTVRASIPLRG